MATVYTPLRDAPLPAITSVTSAVDLAPPACALVLSAPSPTVTATVTIFPAAATLTLKAPNPVVSATTNIDWSHVIIRAQRSREYSLDVTDPARYSARPAATREYTVTAA